MPAPLVGAAALAAARVIAKKLATQAVKKAPVKKVAMTPKQAALKKKAAVKVGPKNSVKVVPKGSPTQNAIKNNIATANAQRAKSGLEAKYTARQVVTGKPNATIKINSGRASRTRSGNSTNR